MSLSDLITHIIIEDTNKKECAAAKAKKNFCQSKRGRNQFQKGTRKNLITKGNIVINPLVPKELTPLSRKRVIASSLESQVIMHLSADIGQKTTILLRQI